MLSAHFGLNNYEKFNELLQQFEEFALSKTACSTTNSLIQTFVYLNIAKINKHFLEGTFTEGLQLVPYIEEKLDEYKLHLDRHRILVFYYKIASLYFGNGDNDKSIDYLNKIINWKVDLRTDLQCYARLLHLIAHYELGNFQLLEYFNKIRVSLYGKYEKFKCGGRRYFFVFKSFIFFVGSANDSRVYRAETAIGTAQRQPVRNPFVYVPRYYCVVRKQDSGRSGSTNKANTFPATQKKKIIK